MFALPKLKPNAASLAVALIAGLSISPAEATEPMETQVVYKGANGASIAATLTRPSRQSADTRFPAMLLIQGSGPTDRDGNQPPRYSSNVSKQIAAALAQQGVASLRFDKRGMYANLADWPKDLDSATQFARWDYQVGDAATGYRFLEQQPDIDPARIGIFGHSEGGVMALELAAGDDVSLRVSPAAIVLAATPGRKLADVLADQLDKIMIRQGAPEDVRRSMLAKNSEIIAHVVEHAQIPPDVPPGLAALYSPYLRLFLQSIFRLDPSAIARRVEAPVLLMNGDRDPQVLADKDVTPLAAALRQRSQPTAVHVFEGLSHTFKPTPSMETNSNEGDIAPEVLQVLGNWLKDIGWSR
jgi:dipeptidyl aminopeptidase/acylaminoacyl peptidase